MSQFVQLSPADCKYLLDLIEEIDKDTAFTARQRGFTIPKLKKLSNDPASARLAYQDVTYLLELIEDDELSDAEQPGIEQQRAMTQSMLLEIQSLQQRKADEIRSIEDQRESRRARRRRPPVENELQAHFAHTSAN